MTKRNLIFSFFLSCAPLVGQVYGKGCDPTITGRGFAHCFGERIWSAFPQIEQLGVPTVGGEYEVRLTNWAVFHPICLTSTARANLYLLTGVQRVAAPIPLYVTVGAQCEQAVIPIVFDRIDWDHLLRPLSLLSFQPSVTFHVPCDPALVGLTLYHQWLFETFTNHGPYPGTWKWMRATSKGLAVTVKP